MYTIKQASARTGVSVPLLRAWERRYGIVAPARTAARYRLYDDAALARIHTMHRLVETGWSPSAAAAAILDETVPTLALGTAAEDGGDGTNRGRASRRDAEALATGDGVTRVEAVTDEVLRAAIALDSVAIERALDRTFALGSFEHVVDTYLMPTLDDLGEAWSSGRLSVASEHFASHAVLRRLAAAFQAGGRPARANGAVLVGMPPGGRHELGALAFAVAAKRAGLPVVYLGPDLPAEDWVAADQRVAARAAVIGSVLADDARAAAKVGRALRARNPGLPVAFGGASAELAATELASMDRVHDRAGSSRDAQPVIVLGDGIGQSVDVLRAALGRRG